MDNSKTRVHIGPSIYAGVKKTFLEKILEREANKTKHELKSGGIAERFPGKENPYNTDRVYIRRATKINKLGQNLIYLREIGTYSINIEEVIKGKYSRRERFGRKEREFIGIGSIASKELYISLGFTENLEEYPLVMSIGSIHAPRNEDLLPAYDKRNNEFIRDLKTICQDLPGEMWRGGPKTIFKSLDKKSLTKVISKVSQNFSNSHYSLGR